MFHPVLPPQLPPSLESLKPVDDAASAPIIKVKTDERKLIIVGKNQDDKYQSNTSIVQANVVEKSFSLLSPPENLAPNSLPSYPEQSAVLAETSIPPNQPSNVNLQESGGKLRLSVGDKKPAAPIQNIIEFKLRNPENQESTPRTVEFPPSPQPPTVEKIPVWTGRVV